MMKNTIEINDLLDRCRKSLPAKSDYELAQIFEVNRGRVSEWRSGQRTPDAYACTRIAQALGRDPMEVIAMIEAGSAKSEAQRDFWKSFKFSGMRNNFGLVLCGMLAFLGAGSHSGNAGAEIIATSHNGGIRKSERRRARRAMAGRRASDLLAA